MLKNKMKFESATELANYLGCRKETITRWIKEGLPCERKSKKVEIQFSDVRDFMMSRSPQHQEWLKWVETKKPLEASE